MTEEVQKNKPSEDQVAYWLREATSTYKEYCSIPKWIEDDYEWYILIGEGEKYWVDYVDDDLIQLTNDEAQEPEEFTSESEKWMEIVEELGTTQPTKST